MSNNHFEDIMSSQDMEITAHLPSSFQMMIEIQEEAQEKVKQILADIKAGRTTLEAVKRSRGLIS